jgi:hypothetical protein
MHHPKNVDSDARSRLAVEPPLDAAIAASRVPTSRRKT